MVARPFLSFLILSLSELSGRFLYSQRCRCCCCHCHLKSHALKSLEYQLQWSLYLPLSDSWSTGVISVFCQDFISKQLSITDQNIDSIISGLSNIISEQCYESSRQAPYTSSPTFLHQTYFHQLSPPRALYTGGLAQSRHPLPAS